MERTPKQIEAEIAKLKQLRPLIPSRTFFGDSNLEKINAEIEVLEEDMEENEIYDKFEDRENPDSSCDLVSAAHYAWQWLRGEEKESMSSQWKPLARKSAKS